MPDVCTCDDEEQLPSNELRPRATPKRFYTVEQLGEKQSITPDGFLLCEDTPIARIGTQVYGEHELPGLVGKDGLIHVMRDESEVFRPQTIASFNGKPVTNNHPPEKVTPNNFRHYAVGVVLNPRRGDGIQYDNNFLYADLLITDPVAIGEVRSGKREVSAGYDAEYEQTVDGEGRQYGIVGNHVALVNRGRCGPLCSIGDEEMPKVSVTDRRRRAFRDRIMNAFRTGDEGALVEELEKVPEMLGEQVSGESSGGDGRTGDTHVSINLHGSGGGSGAPSISSGGGGIGDEPETDPDVGGSPTAGASGANPMMQEIMQRLDRIEQAIVILAQGDDGTAEGEDPDESNFGDRRSVGDRRGRMADRRSRDQEGPSAPSTEEPMEDPPEALGYGSGTQGTEFESPQMGTEDRGRRTSDRGRRMTGDQQGQRQQFIGDSTSMRAEFQDVLSRVELLAPNVRMPTFDAKVPAKDTAQSMCALKRNALDAAFRDNDKHNFVQVMLAGKQPAWDKMTCDEIAPIFAGASEMVRQHNNATYGRVRPNNQGVRGAAHLLTPADINARNRQKYGLN
jgi:hypothetical protein